MFADNDYVKWLELYRPESLPKDRYALIPVHDEFTLADHFSSVSPAVATEVVCFTQPSPAITPNTSEGSQDESSISKHLTLPHLELLLPYLRYYLRHVYLQVKMLWSN